MPLIHKFMTAPFPHDITEILLKVVLNTINLSFLVCYRNLNKKWWGKQVNYYIFLEIVLF